MRNAPRLSGRGAVCSPFAPSPALSLTLPPPQLGHVHVQRVQRCPRGVGGAGGRGGASGQGLLAGLRRRHRLVSTDGGAEEKEPRRDECQEGGREGGIEQLKEGRFVELTGVVARTLHTRTVSPASQPASVTKLPPPLLLTIPPSLPNTPRARRRRHDVLQGRRVQHRSGEGRHHRCRVRPGRGGTGGGGGGKEGGGKPHLRRRHKPSKGT